MGAGWARRCDALVIFDRDGECLAQEDVRARALAFSPDGGRLAVAGREDLRVLETRRFAVLASVPAWDGDEDWIGYLRADLLLCHGASWCVRDADLRPVSWCRTALGPADGAVVALDPQRHHLAVARGADVAVFRIRIARR